MSQRRMGLVYFALVLLLPVATRAADVASIRIDPHVAVQGSGEVRSAAAKAEFTVGIAVQQSAAAGAAAESARIAKLVTDALTQAGLPKAALQRSTLTVSPVWAYSSLSSKRTRSGYSAVTTLYITTTAIDQVGGFLDAALNAGATDVSSVEFSVADPAATRTEALALAVRNARRDAEAIASAAGGALGKVLSLGTQASFAAGGGELQEVVVTGARNRISQDINTQVVVPEIVTRANVQVDWEFVAR